MKSPYGILILVLAAASGWVLGRGHTPRPAGADSTHHVLYWVDPMHPAYKSNQPGIAPDCGMQLEPVYADSLTPEPISGTLVSTVSDGEVEMQSLSVVTVRMERPEGRQYLRLPGRVVPDETRVYKVNAGVDGFVKETHDDATGNFVRKNQRLAVIYSPEFLTVLGGYLSASERTQNTSSKEDLAATQGTIGVQNWGDRLRNLGVSDAQIAELKQTRRIPEDIYVVSPVNGFILSRNIASNERFERHTEFYRIADLNRVWIIADVTGDQAEHPLPGATVRVIGPDLKSTFAARVSDVRPQVDPATRIVKLRLEADNPSFSLRPDMLVNIEFPVREPAGVSVPRNAVIDSGLEQRVLVEVAKGIFKPRNVEAGQRFQDRIQIVRGLAEGERVAVAASFTVDSEARLKAITLLTGSGEKDRDRSTKSMTARKHGEQNISRQQQYHIGFNSNEGRP